MGQAGFARLKSELSWEHSTRHLLACYDSLSS
jgi:hypothetical protein